MGIILSDFLNIIASDDKSTIHGAFLQALVQIYNGITFSKTIPSSIFNFPLDDHSVSDIIGQMKKKLQRYVPLCMTSLNNPITYLLDELICNIQQHAQTDNGIAYIDYNSTSNSIEIIIADEGITIYGSYISAQKHIDILGDSDASALNLAQSGYSVKNLPDTENRGYGISSNMRMVVDGLKGEFAVLSGNALMVQFPGRKEILSLPPMIDFKGTMVIVRFSATVPNDFDFYKYIS